MEGKDDDGDEETGKEAVGDHVEERFLEEFAGALCLYVRRTKGWEEGRTYDKHVLNG